MFDWQVGHFLVSLIKKGLSLHLGKKQTPLAITKNHNYPASFHVLCPKPAQAGAPERRLPPALRARGL
jgi:hypothetical protein